jgi:predicted NUDIX family NTP pyrophosphohydrolase
VKRSAGLLIHRDRGDAIEIFLVHPGGPFWAKKDDGAWSIPKGEYDEGEDALAVAKRELFEETGLRVDGEFVKLEPIRQRSGKIVTAFAIAADFDPAEIRSNSFQLEWPPKSGRMQEFPEVDRAAWFAIAQARIKLLASQAPLLDQIEARLKRAR